ncbi:uncharacterized protein LOC122503591 [Leptopilina heterotoma]|uniref:uncharacterized protein LOC122503591 n=1 Tax=Leptopilina heterotoma TaxID=63436 RepID=UPI001CA84A7D|nr:uncharacterized protein LOC122503591 [Leptopilina heterotoma]
MDGFSINTIQETVHLVSMFSYMNTLSDFLFSKSLIAENEKYQLLPVANGIYRYLEDDTPPIGIQEKKRILIKEVINGSDIYGGKKDEIPDPIFVNELFKRIITSIVFNNDTNIYGFILNEVRNSSTTDVGILIDKMRDTLNRTLPSLVFERVFNDYILPLFPQPEQNLTSSSVASSINLTSVEFIYAQAGAMFLLSGTSNPEIEEFLHTNKKQDNFHECLHLAHIIENLIFDEKVDGEFVWIFTLPAMLYYVRNDREKLVDETTANIVTNPEHVQNALEQLFTYLNETIDGIISTRNNDTRYQFLLAMSDYKNRTVIARELIEEKCFLPNGTNVNDEIIRYKNNYETFSCSSKRISEIIRILNNGSSGFLLNLDTKNVGELLPILENGNIYHVLVDLHNGSISELLLLSKRRDINEVLLGPKKENISEVLEKINHDNNINEFLPESQNYISNLLLDLTNESTKGMLLILNNGNISGFLLPLTKEDTNGFVLIPMNKNVDELLPILTNGNIRQLLMDLNNRNIGEFLLDLNNGNINEMLPIRKNGNINLEDPNKNQIQQILGSGNILNLLPYLNRENNITHQLYQTVLKTYQTNLYQHSKELLPNINELFNQQNEKISEKYHHYEKDALAEVFGDTFIEIQNGKGVEISQGLYKAFYAGEGIAGGAERQALSPQVDLLKFRYNSGEIVYYALVRKNNTIELIAEADNDKFREQLGLSVWEKFNDRDFKIIKKSNEMFTTLINRIADDRRKSMLKNLKAEGYDITRKEWWKDFGLNLIPFYTCWKAFQERDEHIGVPSCTIDGLMVLSVFADIAQVVDKFLMQSTRLAIARAEIKFTTLMLRESITEISEKTLKNVAFGLRKEMFRGIATTVIRFLDPGVEHLFKISKFSLSAIWQLTTKLSSRLQTNFPLFTKIYNFLNQMTKGTYRKLNTIYGKNLYVKTINDHSTYGYGYKFFENPSGQLRFVTKREEEIYLVLLKGKNNEKIYKEINPYTGHTKSEYHLQNRFPHERVENSEVKFKLPEELKTNCLRTRRQRRSPEFFCKRLMSLLKREEAQKEALKTARRLKFPLPDNINDILNSYLYTNTNNEINFILDWIKEGKLPLYKWSSKKLRNPQEFHALLYWNYLDNPYLSEWEANQLIATTYNKNDRKSIELFKPINQIHNEFLQYRAYESMSFIDFYSIGNYLHRGSRKLSYSTNEALLMKQAIYRLAIRQSDLEFKGISKVYFATELREFNDFENTFLWNEKQYLLPEFITTTTNLLSAMEYVHIMGNNYVKVLYQFRMNNNFYSSARINNVFKNNIEETILLPGTKFRIDNVSDYVLGDEKVKLVELSLDQKLTKARILKKITDNLYYLEQERKLLNPSDDIVDSSLRLELLNQ